VSGLRALKPKKQKPKNLKSFSKNLGFSSPELRASWWKSRTTVGGRRPQVTMQY